MTEVPYDEHELQTAAEEVLLGLYADGWLRFEELGPTLCAMIDGIIASERAA